MKKAVIIGGGVSGIAAEKLLNKHHWSTLIVSDDNCKKLPEADLIIASPGVPPLTSKVVSFLLIAPVARNNVR